MFTENFFWYASFQFKIEKLPKIDDCIGIETPGFLMSVSMPGSWSQMLRVSTMLVKLTMVAVVAVRAAGRRSLSFWGQEKYHYCI